MDQTKSQSQKEETVNARIRPQGQSDAEITTNEIWNVLSGIEQETQNQRILFVLYIATLHFVLKTRIKNYSTTSDVQKWLLLGLDVIFQRIPEDSLNNLFDELWTSVEERKPLDTGDEYIQTSFYTFLKGLEQEHIHKYEYYGYPTIIHIAVALKYLALAYDAETEEENHQSAAPEQPFWRSWLTTIAPIFWRSRA